MWGHVVRYIFTDVSVKGFASTLAVAQLVEVLCHKLEGCGFDSKWGHWIFKLTWSFQPHYGLGVDSASNRNEYQESSWGKGRLVRGADNLTAICEPIV
jgi:hypothetical protein